MKDFNDWVASKILRYLTAKEGFTVVGNGQVQGDITATVQDTFGFRYEITVKTVGRVHNDLTDNNAELYVNNHPRYKQS